MHLTSIGEHPICAATRKDGEACTARALPGSAYCFAHDPARQGALQASRERGGKSRAAAARAEKLVPAVLRPVLDTLLGAVDEVKAGTITTQQAGALSSLAGAIVKVYQVGTLEERIGALEAAQEAQAAQGTRKAR